MLLIWYWINRCRAGWYEPPRCPFAPHLICSLLSSYFSFYQDNLKSVPCRSSSRMGEIQGRRDEIEIWTLFFRKRSLLSSCNAKWRRGQRRKRNRYDGKKYWTGYICLPCFHYKMMKKIFTLLVTSIKIGVLTKRTIHAAHSLRREVLFAKQLIYKSVHADKIQSTSL